MGTIRGVIWDIDGTLLDSNDAHARAYQEALAGEDIPRPYDQIRRKIGMGSDKLLPSLIGCSSNSELGKRIGKSKQKIFDEKFFPHLRAFPKAYELVEHLHRSGFRLAVGTSASKKDCERFLKILNIRKFIDEIVSADDIDQSKPDPDVVQESVARLKCTADEVVMIGDTPYDVLAARRANVQAISFRTGAWSDEELKESTEIYDGPAQLLSQFAQSVLHSKTSERLKKSAEGTPNANLSTDSDLTLLNRRPFMNTSLPQDKAGHSIGEVLGKIGASAQDLMQSEINLARSEMKESADRLARHAVRVAVIGALTSISFIPFVAFLVIGLGKILGDNYWASSLIVSVILTSVGGSFAYATYLKIKNEDGLSMPRTRAKLEQETAVVARKIDEAKNTAAENVRNIRNATKGIN